MDKDACGNYMIVINNNVRHFDVGIGSKKVLENLADHAKEKRIGYGTSSISSDYRGKVILWAEDHISANEVVRYFRIGSVPYMRSCGRWESRNIK